MDETTKFISLVSWVAAYCVSKTTFFCNVGSFLCKLFLPTWLWYWVKNYFLPGMRQVSTWYWDRYKTGTRLVLPQVPTRRVLVQSWYRLSSYQPGRVLDAAGVYSLYQEPGYVPYQTNKNWFLHLYKVGGSKAHKTHSFMLRERERERKKERERGMDGQRINRRGKGQNKACTHRGK